MVGLTRLAGAVALALFAAGCAGKPTPYQPISSSSRVAGGYSETRLAADHFRVTFVGNSFTQGAHSAARNWGADMVTDLNGAGYGGVPALFKLFAEQAAAGILEGRECSAYPACGPEVQLAGGQYMDIGVDQAHVQGNLVTAPAWPAHPNWLAAFLGLLGTQISL